MSSPLPPPPSLCARSRWEWEAYAEKEIRRRRPGAEVRDELVAAGVPWAEAEVTVQRISDRERTHAAMLIGGGVAWGLVCLAIWQFARARGLLLAPQWVVALVLPVVALVDGFRRLARIR